MITALDEYNNRFQPKSSKALDEHNAALKKAGKGHNMMEIKDKSDLKAQYQNFIKLLMTQLKHQDPSEPMKNEDFVSQLVQFSLVEQSLNSNETQKKLLEEQRLSHMMNASSFIDKEVEVSSKEFFFDGTKNVKLGYEIPSDADSAKLTIFDESGQIVSVSELESRKGHHIFEWNGETLGDSVASEGSYTFGVTLRNSKGEVLKDASLQPMKVPTSVFDVAQGLVMDNQMPQIKLGKLKMPLDSIISIQTVK